MPFLLLKCYTHKSIELCGWKHEAPHVSHHDTFWFLKSYFLGGENRVHCIGHRIKKFYHKSKLATPSKSDLKQQAKCAKGFMILVKRKLQRGQLCRGKLFRKLMALVFDPEDMCYSLLLMSQFRLPYCCTLNANWNYKPTIFLNAPRPYCSLPSLFFWHYT